MFHGPAFQSVTVLGTLGNSGATAGLTVRHSDRLFASIPDPQMLTDPCVMDGIGQVVGLWAKMYGLYVLPIGVDKIEFYGPPPPPGTTVPIRIEVVEVNREAIHMRSHVELGDGQGGLWARLAGWADFIMPASDQYVNATDLPHRYVWSEELSLPGAPPGSVCTLLTQEHFKGVNLEWTARVFLHAQELAEYQAIDKAARRRQFLASRAAAKDAIRLWWSRQHGDSELPHPSTFVIAHDAAGRPYLETEEESALPRLIIAHTEAGAVALVADVPVGIDIEPVTANSPAILSSFATTAEMGLIEELVDASPDSAGYRTELEQAEAALTTAQAQEKELEHGREKEEIDYAEALLKQAKVPQRQAQIEYERAHKLHPSAISRAEYDKIVTTWRDTQAAVNVQQRNLNRIKGKPREEKREAAAAEVRRAKAVRDRAKYFFEKTRIIAPADSEGKAHFFTVLQKNVNPGESIQAELTSTALCTLADLTQMEAEIDVQERDLGILKIGAPCEIIPDAYSGRVYSGHVNRKQPVERE